MIKAVIFDFGGVISRETRKSPRDLSRVMKMLEEAGVSYCEEELDRMIDSGLEDYKKFSYGGWVELDPKGICRHIFRDDGEWEKIEGMAEELLYEIDAGSFTTKVEGGVEETFQELQRRGYRLALISNTMTSVVKEFLRGEGLSGYFELEIYSHEEGLRKPGRELFDKARDFLGLEPEECAYVGDRFDKDIAGAKDAGYGIAILMDYEGKHRSKGKADHRITDLRELLEIFE